MPHLQLDPKHELYYQRIAGNDDQPCLVFLHEGLGCVEMWKDFPELLCQITGCPGLIYDRLGYGESSPLIDRRTVHYLHDYALLELPKVIDHLIPDTPYILVGHSDGGSISLIYGAQQRPFLKGIISEAAHVFVDDETIAGIEETTAAWDAGQLAGLAKYHGDKTESIFRAWSNTWLSAWFRSWDIRYVLPSVEVPVLVIQGQADKYGTKAQVNAITFQSAGEARAEMISDCGHAPHHEAREKVVTLMAEFIARVGSSD